MVSKLYFDVGDLAVVDREVGEEIELQKMVKGSA